MREEGREGGRGRDGRTVGRMEEEMDRKKTEKNQEGGGKGKERKR